MEKTEKTVKKITKEKAVDEKTAPKKRVAKKQDSKKSITKEVTAKKDIKNRTVSKKAVEEVKPEKKETTKKVATKKVTKKTDKDKAVKDTKKASTRKATTKKAEVETIKEVETPLKKKRIALVLEGGGMRGAYTAGCLSWLLDEGIEFAGAYGISSGAVHLTSYLHGKKNWLFDMSTNYIPEKSSIGLGGFLKEGQVCAFDYKFANAKKHLGFTIENLKTDVNAKIGLYDLNIGKVEYYPVEKMNDEMLKAACSLPILSVSRKVKDHEYLDAGITDMIPIEQAVKEGYDGYLVITTKAKDYVRKKTNPIIVNLMRLWYLRCPNVSKDYAIRSDNYYKQINMIKSLEEKGEAVYRYPTVNMTNITRFGGEPEDLTELFNLGRNDMEAIKEDIYKLFK